MLLFLLFFSSSSKSAERKEKHVSRPPAVPEWHFAALAAPSQLSRAEAAEARLGHSTNQCARKLKRALPSAAGSGEWNGWIIYTCDWLPVKWHTVCIFFSACCCLWCMDSSLSWKSCFWFQDGNTCNMEEWNLLFYRFLCLRAQF